MNHVISLASASVPVALCKVDLKFISLFHQHRKAEASSLALLSYDIKQVQVNDNCSTDSRSDIVARSGPSLMTLVEARPVTLSSSGLVKMEDRKRPASYDTDEAAPPHKRQVTAAVNGNSRSHQDLDVPGKDELEVSFIRMLGHRLAWLLMRSVSIVEVSKGSDSSSDAGIQAGEDNVGASAQRCQEAQHTP